MYRFWHAIFYNFLSGLAGIVSWLPGGMVTWFACYLVIWLVVGHDGMMWQVLCWQCGIVCIEISGKLVGIWKGLKVIPLVTSYTICA